ncbi:MAG: nucleotide sugar dehydrogenase [Candidatus Berkelbacteria bacterium]
MPVKKTKKEFKPKIAVVGIGYVGLPVALLFAKAGYDVIGLDVDQARVAMIMSGENPIKGREPGMDELVKTVVKTKKFLATTDATKLGDRDMILVAVQTPVEEDHMPRYEALRAACKSIAHHMKRGAQIVIESTIAPTTMEKIVRPAIEHENGFELNKDYLLSNCPERVMPGKLIYNLTHYDRLVGAFNKKAGEQVKSLYEKVLGIKVDITDPLTAEIVKSGENTYRDVQIAFANEMALLSEAYGANVWKVREFLNKCPGRAMHLPGAGVGGHCIPKDSWLLIYGAKDSITPKLIPLARSINNFMPQHMFDLLKMGVEETGKDINKVKVAILGYAYDANSDDTRNTPTTDLMKVLDENKVKYTVQDPYVKEYNTDLGKTLKGADAIVLMVGHDEYIKVGIKGLKDMLQVSEPIVIDGRNIFDKQKAEKEGFVYKGVGNI